MGNVLTRALGMGTVVLLICACANVIGWEVTVASESVLLDGHLWIHQKVIWMDQSTLVVLISLF